ncbi:hypothetical protein BST83_12170 [Polaribacter filamentus]|uniref:Glycosyl transferase family 1 domain-containing protein n=1 Tax=Polaribacter filamentus TaxID=53483 RepID=A0A2S7KYS1_9FLAO|nr:glycosyltransferase [Polaribacter filamentus]PQB07824.1 hypothetical protein BST83_12170 [Polaribacter filamentus]
MLFDYYPRLKNTFIHRSLLRKETFVLSKIDKVGFVSKNSSVLFKEIHKDFDFKKVFFVHNGIEDISYIPKNKQIDNNKLILTCAASISERKGQDILVKAAALLDEKARKKLKIYLLGVGPLMSDLYIFVKNNNLVDVIIFKGQVNDVNKYLLESDGFILTSRDEGLPMCIIEAMRVGLPIIATNIAGIPEQVINNENGYLINPSINELKAVLELALNDRIKFKEKGLLSRRLYEEKFILEKMLFGYSFILREV